MNNNNSNQIGYLTIKQSAQFCGLSVSTIRNLIRAGKIAAYKPSSRRIVISARSIVKYIEAHKMPAAEGVCA